jgi:hypothetical protein
VISHVGNDTGNRFEECKDSFGVAMTNYGEVLTYWYLRLNGFFPITNFVLHDVHQGENRKYSGDCDLLAVRFPHVSEKIRGQDLEWDPDFFEDLGSNFDRPVGLIVQVKTGQSTQKDLIKSFSEDTLTYAIRRIGLVEEDQVPNLVGELMNCAKLIKDDFILAKLAVFGRPSREDNKNPFIIKDIHELDKFIRDSIKEYENTKRADRMFFSDPLIQYLAGMGQ